MQATKQQQIVGFFIDEAKEHLDSIEHGLLNLSATMVDREAMNELFRAAHSIKGGAAMLGFTRIQKVAHHLEDAFKLLTEHSIQSDVKLEDLFLKVFDVLKALIEKLSSTFGLGEDEAAYLFKAAEPLFTELEQYLQQLIHKTPAQSNEPSQLPANAADLVGKILKVMLQLFRQGDSPKNRQQLTELCQRLIQVSPQDQPWITLVQTAQQGITNPKLTYATLAPIVIRELKQASDLLVQGQSNQIIPSPALQQFSQPLQPQPLPSPASQITSSKANPPQPVQPDPTSITPIETPTPSSNREELPVATALHMTRQRQIAIPAEPRAAARALLDAFNRDELIQIAEFLMKAIQT